MAGDYRLMAPTYEVNLYLNGTLIGDCRSIAQDLKWARRRTKAGVDEIDFTLNDVLFSDWCIARNTDINSMLKPYALECRLKRNGIEIVGGFLATMPAYSPNGTSANLEMKFDGWLNLLAGVYIRPVGTVSGNMDYLIDKYIKEADARALAAGKAFGFKQGTLEQLPSIEHTFDNYKATKDWFCDRCDNTTGAGPFDIIFDADKTYNVYSQANAGDVITDWTANYPANINYTSAMSISASEVSGFASAVIGLGSGEISSNADKNTAITSFNMNSTKVMDYGYVETLMQNSSISVQETLDDKVETQLAIKSKVIWQPQITLIGRQVEPKPTGSNKIWICDIITIKNTEDLTGMTNGQFRVNELQVSVSATGAETIKPTLERV
jgi:hypothetical protein